MFRRNQQSRRSFLSALVLILGLLLTTSKSQAQSGGNPQAIPPTARPYGLTYGQWSANWWHWALTLPLPGHPFAGCPPEPGDAGQTGPVWFLAGSNPPPPSCYVTIPAGKSLFVALANTECSSLEDPPFHGDTAAQQTTCANYWANHIVQASLFCEIDGAPLKNLARYRFTSPQFAFTAPTPWIFGATGGSGSSVGDGYYLMLPPFSGGSHHTLHFGGAFHFSIAGGDDFDADFGFEGTYHLTVTP